MVFTIKQHCFAKYQQTGYHCRQLTYQTRLGRHLFIMSETRISLDNPKSLSQLSDNDFQSLLLEGVSRTFALTIPQLPEKLYGAVANAYLLCRIVDTIEDEVSLSAGQKKYFCSEFIDIVKTGVNAEPFAVELAPLLSEQTSPAEHTLIHVLPRVIQITHTFDDEQIDALAGCVETMAEGMPIFQAQNLHYGLGYTSRLGQVLLLRRWLRRRNAGKTFLPLFS